MKKQKIEGRGRGKETDQPGKAVVGHFASQRQQALLLKPFMVELLMKALYKEGSLFYSVP